MDKERLIRLPEVEKRVGLRHSTIYSYIKQGRFPKQVRLAARAVAWPESKIDEFIADRIKQSRVHVAQVGSQSPIVASAGDLRLLRLQPAKGRLHLDGGPFGVVIGKVRGVIGLEVTSPQGYEALSKLCPEEDRDSLDTFRWPTDSMEPGHWGDGVTVAIFRWPEGVDQNDLAAKLPDGLIVHAMSGLIPIDPVVLHGVRLEETDESSFRIADGELEHATILQFPKCLLDYIRSNAVKAPKRPPQSEVPPERHRRIS
jgi:prophage regulatory protein